MAITAKQKQFIEKVGKLAAADIKASGVLASLTIAQAILESGWGESGLTVKGNALFGIKAGANWKGKVYSGKTQECYDGATFEDVTATFRAYDSWEESIKDHSALLTGAARYKAVISERDYKAACIAIKAAGYATDPAYSTKLINLIESYGLTAYDGAGSKGEEKMTEAQARSNVVSIAQGFNGCKESDGSHKKIIDIYNSYKPLARGYAMKYTDAWCACFVSTVSIQAGYTDIMPTECGCGQMIELYKKLGTWQENDAYTPKPGDVIFYDWEDSGNGDNTGTPDHVGIVVSVTGAAIKVIEGNISNAVGFRNIAVNGKCIRGYGLPNYAKKATVPAQQPTTDNIYKVVSGDTLSKIAAKNGTTVVKLAEINGIANVNIISVGQIIMLNDGVSAAVEKLHALGIINSPDYWKGNYSKLNYTDALLIKAAKKITKKGTPAVTVEAGIDALTNAGVINSPDYWKGNYSKLLYCGDLIKALGGSV